MKKTKLFKQLVEAEEILVTPGVYDGITVRLVQAMGFKAASISGAGISESRLGKTHRTDGIAWNSEFGKQVSHKGGVNRKI